MSYDPSAHDKIVQGMANTLWWLVWADIAEENGVKLSGKRIDLEAPPTPQKAFMLAERWLGYVEGYNKTQWGMLLYSAWKCDKEAGTKAGTHGFNPEKETLDFSDYQGEYAERFGECLAYGVGGHGVSWRDDHAAVKIFGYEKEFEIPLIDCGESHNELYDDAFLSLEIEWLEVENG